MEDLSTLFEDPDDPSATLKFMTTTSDATKVQVVKKTTGTDGTTDTTAPPTADPAVDVAAEVKDGKDVVLFARAVGSAMITVKVIDGDELSIMETFMVTVTEAANNDPTQGDDGSNATSLIGEDRLKFSGNPVKVIDDKPINDYFDDLDFDTSLGDMLKFRVEHTNLAADAVPAPAGTPLTVTVPPANMIPEDEQVAFVELSTYTWDGDPLGGEDKFTVTVRPRKAGAAQTIVIIATDKAGAEHYHSFQVAVNNPPKAEGVQKTPLKLSSFKGAEGLKSTSASVNVYIVAPLGTEDADTGGYFSDKDMTVAGGGGDTLTCSFRPSLTMEKTTAPAEVTWDADTGNNAENNTESVTLVVNPKDTYSSDFVPMTVTVWCNDGLEDTAEQTFTVSVTAQASIQ